MNDNKFMGLRIRWWRMHEQRSTMNSWGSELNGGGCMNDIQFMGHRIRFDERECTNNAWKSIHRAPDSMEEDA